MNSLQNIFNFNIHLLKKIWNRKFIKKRNKIYETLHLHNCSVDTKTYLNLFISEIFQSTLDPSCFVRTHSLLCKVQIANLLSSRWCTRGGLAFWRDRWPDSSTGVLPWSGRVCRRGSRASSSRCRAVPC